MDEQILESIKAELREVEKYNGHLSIAMRYNLPMDVVAAIHEEMLNESIDIELDLIGQI